MTRLDSIERVRSRIPISHNPIHAALLAGAGTGTGFSRRRMTDLMKQAGTCTDPMTVEELQAQRRQE